MKLIYTLILTFVCAFSAFSEETKPLWLAKDVSVENDAGVHGYVVGTPIMKEGDKYRVGIDLITLAPDFIASIEPAPRFITIRPFSPVAKPVPAPVPVPAPKAVAPKLVAGGPPLLTPAQGGLQMSGGLNGAGGAGAGGAGSGALGGTTNRIVRGIHANADGTLGAARK